MSHPEYPRWDESLATLLESTDDYHVDNDIDATEDGGLRIRRTVWKRARARKDQHILWTGDVVIIPPNRAREFVIDAVDARSVAVVL